MITMTDVYFAIGIVCSNIWAAAGHTLGSTLWLIVAVIASPVLNRDRP